MRETNFLIENNARHLWHPMAHPAEMQAHPPRIVNAAEGVEIVDIHGKKVLDAVGGLWNVNLGYSSDPVKKAIRDQLDELPYYSTFRGTTNAPLIELSYELAEWFKEDGLTRSFFTSGGSDSVETCLRLARQYHKINGQPERTKFVALKKGYHGTHFGGASVNGNQNFRRNYEPLLPGVFHLPAPWTYRNPFGTSDGAEIAAAIGRLFEEEIAFQGADTIAALIVEPVLGAGGVIVPHETFLPLMREICDRHGILLIADEVITAFGRTGAWTGSRLWGVKPDLMSTAKAITNGYYPFGAVMIADKVAEVFESNKSGVGTIGHGYTYSGHPVGAAAALATLKETMRLNVAANAAARGEELLRGLEELQGKHELVGDVRGKGLMCALELVSDREKKTPASKDVLQTVQDVAYEAGVLVRTSGSNVILSPPLVITTQDVGRIVDAIDAALAATGSR
ncbi:omega amino acid--pyruvate aminotransferase [Sinorhizobium fredii USDA 205]|uniref:Aminotransferase class III-fold pyridoxal phosphate-dependent enzyme n=1 Tax=Rhizobium fredii TaxID=380 RepID=A0A844ABN1_RHIFR|nr:aspartate aminotransferase family protein [Sinorhizobium fredii]ASY72931.1 Omega-amino acid--pyruvate aminotransferase [Sinorhizobium fredii CCBAU 83666]AWM29073.1 Omega-amino acid--pyruvate aminotransferase [Sinorhizobium fredii CCBAU 25509]KSV85890.1 omega amino acid--pyruvate aminotransferase [Sinorhizobium fredii USDA 205]MCG5474914.1 aspartate aminotransferase family protein [Sinorhizobium fredii]MQX09492.1 aminotransferase class III-fold pyridoxal phosphate-dependent enzyme [Sinorhizo